ncbi:type II and III secretion system protein family protein [Actibacterium pelagium]|uniref:General secretion pathway protein n=1 Tax=Actibacterium pelagium TaxID=2029103 RepID=A0A917AL61_9RHOB|nr:type II and III secretion system protein family protein [Actibacterium pelagium]GGE60124.1 general secretion pathway protein [Actibacterium pelagium]
MKIKNIFKAALLGCAVLFTVPQTATAETLRILSEGTANKLTIPMNRAVVVESESIFGELSIANAAIADISTLSDRTIYVLGKAPGRTTLTLLGPEGNLISNVEIQVIPDLSELKERLREVLPGEPVQVRSANDGIILSGIVSSSGTIARAIELASRYAPGRVTNLMYVGGSQQVMLKVRFAEMEKEVTKALSSSLNISDSDGNVIGVNGGTTGAVSGSGALGTANLANSTGVFNFGFDLGSVEFNVLLEALEEKDFIRSLAEPNLIALSGQEAEFLAGGEVPIQVRTDGENNIEFKKYGILLNFTPNVVGKNINLKLTAEVSEPTIEGAFTVRRSTTTVELHDGESFAIAGLLADDFEADKSQVPWLGDVPILGSLFRSASYQRRQSELVVLITAHLVSPTRGEFLALPTDGVLPPSEYELFINGKLSSDPGATSPAVSEVARQDFSGSYGYVME